MDPGKLLIISSLMFNCHPRLK